MTFLFWYCISSQRKRQLPHQMLVEFSFGVRDRFLHIFQLHELPEQRILSGHLNIIISFFQTSSEIIELNSMKE
jgi:hypothetical protein